MSHRGPTKSLQDLKELMMPLSFQCNLPRLQQYCESRETIVVMPKKNKHRDYRRAKQKGVCFSTSERRRCSSIENDILLVGFGKIFKLCFFHLERQMFEGGYI